jgi:serine/threonine-protein kinase
MKEERWERIKTIVDHALTLSGRERDTYLSTICRKEPEICAEIEELLLSIEQSEEEQFMQHVRRERKELVSELSEELKKSLSWEELIGSVIGSYRITGQLGSGGMGMVFKGERMDGEFQHQVAIKLIRKGFGSEKIVSRFKMEREILANLSHPNIAHLHDGGVLKDGTPYLIMEYIDGIPIDRYCNEQKLTVNQRLELFKKICSAVQYAHSKLVVHRDLKPDNIYVNSDGEVKILDFGVAKLLDTELTEATLLETRPGQKLWTPQYAAPEQIRGEQVAIQTDIYALGILLHKLLTDTYPFDLKEKNLREIEHTIVDDSPASLTQSLRNSSSLKEIAEHRNTTPQKLLKNLTGDLNALVLKAIRKEPEHRYESVSRLLEDIERYQSGIPLIARKGTWKYRGSKFLRRHKTGLTVMTVFLIAAISFSLLYTWRISQERNRAEMEAQKAEQVTEFMMGLFESNNPGESLGDTVTARQLLETGVNQAEQLTDQPEVQAQMFDVVGRVYRNLGEYEKSYTLLKRSLDMRTDLYGDTDPEVAGTLSGLGTLMRLQGKYAQAAVTHRKALAIWRELYGNEHENVAEGLNNLAVVLHRQGKRDSAEVLYRQALNMRRNLLGDEHKDIAVTLNNLGTLFREKGDYERAEKLLSESLGMRRSLFGEKHPKVAISLGNLALLYRNKGDYDQAETFFRQTLELWRELLGENHPYIATSLNDLGVLLLDKGELDEAEPLLREALTIRKKVLGEQHPNVAQSLNNLAGLLLDQGKLEEAEFHYREALAIRRKLLGEEHRLVAYTLHNLAKVLSSKENYTEAEPLYRKAIDILEDASGNDHWLTAYFKSNIGACLTAMENYENAESFLKTGYQVLEEKRGSEDRYTQKALDHLINLYEMWNKPEKAKILRKELVANN